jgi:hypothetical protein
MLAGGSLISALFFPIKLIEVEHVPVTKSKPLRWALIWKGKTILSVNQALLAVPDDLTVLF